MSQMAEFTELPAGCRTTMNLSCFHTVICPPLSLRYGEVKYNTSLLTDDYQLNRGYSINTTASFSCDEHNITEGSTSAICQNSGNWSEQLPICSIDYKGMLRIKYCKLYNTMKHGVKMF